MADTQENVEVKQEEQIEPVVEDLDTEPPNNSSITQIQELLKQQNENYEPIIAELIQQTLMNSPFYKTEESLTDANDVGAVIFWGKTISDHAKKIKQHFLKNKRKQYDESDITQVLKILVFLLKLAIEKFEIASNLCSNGSMKEIDASAIVSVKKKKLRGQLRYAPLELAYEWGLTAIRLGKILELQTDLQSAAIQYDSSIKLFLRIVQEDRKRKFTGKVFNKIAFAFELLAKVKPTSTDVRTYCDLFLVQFSNIAMRGEMKKLSLKPLIAMILSDSRYIKEANAIDVVRHLATFFKDDVANEANKQLAYLETIFQQSGDNEAKLKKQLTPITQQRLIKAAIRKEDYIDHIDILINLLNWKPLPPCKLPFYKPISNTSTWKNENPANLFNDKHRIDEEELGGNGSIYIARRKPDRIPVLIKVLNNYQEREEIIKTEVGIMQFLSAHDNFTHVLSVYLFRNEVWVVCEYCDAGSLAEFIAVSMMREYEVAYIAREILHGLNFLHENNQIHRDLTSDNILLNMNGDVLITDLDIWDGKPKQRYWIPPELLLPTRYPYGTEIDIWSLGCILLEMANGYSPYSQYHLLKEYFFTAVKGAPPLLKPTRWSNEFHNFLASCVNVDPAKRGTAKQLLGHPWFQKACSRKEFAKVVETKVSWGRW